VTTSYDSDQVQPAGISSAMPEEGADGQLTWNPSVGIYHRPAYGKRESFGGIIGALQDSMYLSGTTPKSYPENFAGIIAAIQDLGITQYQPGSEAGPKPPGDSIDNSDPDNPILTPGDHVEGQLWFDTRQGRLFVWADDGSGAAWTQTNGADGLPILSETEPPKENLVPGQFWYDTANDTLYIFDGDFISPAGVVSTVSTAANIPVWKPIAGAGYELQTTATLPLAFVGPKVLAVSGDTYLPDVDLESTMHNQKDYNEWLFASVNLLDQGLSEFQSVHVGIAPPDAPDEGQLWFDTESLDMSIWYDDGSTQQWVPTSVGYNYDEDLDTVKISLANETRLREQAINDLHQKLNEINDDTDIIKLGQDIAAVNHRINVLPAPDLTAYANKADVIADLQTVIDRISALENNPTDLTGYQTHSQATNEYSALQGQINQKASVSALNAVENSIPDVGLFVTQADIDNSIDNITTEYLPRTGGRLTGSFTLSKADISLPGIDFSETSGSGVNAIKFATYSPDPTNTTTLGTTDKLWECAWKFNNEEDFCWIYNDTNKVFSITKDGPACSSLVLGDFANNNAQGRVIVNKIDVKERLNNYQSAFEEIRQGVSSATDFDSLKANILSALANV